MTSAAPGSSAPAESATVLLLRDGERGLEVFMVRRNLNSDFVGGAYVFPGGRVDADDCDLGLLSRMAGVTLHEASGLTGTAPERALGHWAAAIRETFEEAGVLLAGPAGMPAELTGDLRERTTTWHEAMAAGSRSWGDMLVAEDWLMAGDRLGYFAHWITPEGSRRRYDTRFFVAMMPVGQVPLADEREVEDGQWVRPQDALNRHGAGTMTMIFPTIKTLQELATFETVGAVMANCRTRTIVANLPRVVKRNGEPHVLLPGDPGYDEAAGSPAEPFDPSKLL